MIARPIRRPHPIPFEAPHLSAMPPGTRPITWPSADGAPRQAANQTHAHMDGAAPLGMWPAQGQPAMQMTRPSEALAAMNRPIGRLSPVVAGSAFQASANDASSRRSAPAASANGHDKAHGMPPAKTSGTGPDAPRTGQTAARYVGHGSLSVRSSVTGRHYRFQGHGDSQFVDKHDLMLLRRIPDLVLL